MKPIVIVGAGIAGLYTSFVLAKKGVPVVLVEKEKSLGGRMYTEEIHPTKDKTFFIEGGAGVVSRDEDLIVDLCQSLGVELKFWHSETAIVFNDGKKSEILEFDFRNVLKKACEDAEPNKAFGDVVIDSDLELIQKIGLLIGTTYSELYSANSVHVCDENDFNEFYINQKNVEYGKPVLGWKKLVDVLETKIKKYKGEIYRECPVKEIGKDYVLVNQRGGKNIQIDFSELIITCPMHFMSKIRLNEALKDWYLLASKNIEETNYLRVYSYFESPLKITMKIATNLPLQRVIPINDQLIMTVYNDGSNADTIYKMHNNQKKLSRYIQKQLEILLERKVPSIKKNWVIFWKNGIANWRPSKKEPQKVLPLIQHPVDNVHFCGDTYSLHPGWILGAMESSNETLDILFSKYDL